VPPNTLAINREIVAQNLSRSACNSQQSRTGAQQTCLASSVWTLEQNQFTVVHFKVETRQGRKAAEKYHGSTETNDRGHARVDASQHLN